MRSSLTSFLDDYAARGAETAFATRRGLRVVRWSYARVAETAHRFARELAARGIVRGDRVLFWAENSPEWVAAFFGCALGGVIVVPLDVESAPDFVSRVQQQTEAKLLLVGGHDGQSRIEGASGSLPLLRLEELSEVVARHAAAPLENEDIEADAILEIIYTSGTTAEPRGVCLTHGNILANLAPLEKEMEKYRRWERLTVHPLRFLNLLPLSHVFGQFMGIFVPQLLGGEVHFHDSLNPSEIINAVKQRRISVVVTVPRLLDTLRDSIERDYASRGATEEFKRTLTAAKKWHWMRRWWVFRRIHGRFGWKFWAFISGGAALSAETESFWQRAGFLVLQGYGMTETASLISVNHPFKAGRGSVGKSLPGHEVKLDESGEILVRGANVSPGYWRRGVEPLTDAEGWLRTGDLGTQDAAGNIYFKGRKKDVIVTAAGLNIHPEDLEAALNRQPEVRLSAVVGVEGARGSEPLAVLILRDERADAAQAITRANSELARHQQIRHWYVWADTDFPRTPTHKVRKRDILAKIQRETAKARNGENGKSAGGAQDGRGNGRGQNFDAFTPDASARISDASHVAADTAADTSHVAQAQSVAASSSSAVLDEVIRVSGEAPARVDASSNLATDLKLDSLGRVELLSALEDRYQVEIDEASFTAATTLGDIEKIIHEGTGGEVANAASRYPYPEWAQRFPITWLRLALFYLMALPITRLLCWVRVRGKEHLSELQNRPALFISNHITYFDHALILSALPGNYRRSLAIAMEGERLRHWRNPPAATEWWRRLRWLAQYYLVITFFNTFPLPQKSGFRRSFSYAGESVDRGYSVLVFPEGTRTEHGGLNPFMRGTGLLASKLNVPVVPVRIDGLSELKLRGRRGFALPWTVTVKFGEPVSFAADDDPALITSEMERRVAAL
ncbi:MAG TPA: AMP-binding protein [Pyrinomonadaceae bacterium]|jgi:long-chain acyl-CoA synthetase